MGTDVSLCSIRHGSRLHGRRDGLPRRGDPQGRQVFLENADAVTYTEYAKKKTVTAMEVVCALKRQ